METKNGKMRNGAKGGETATRVIGVGGAGWHMLRALASRGSGGLSLVEVNTDLRAVDPIEGAARIGIGARVTRGLGAGGDPSVGERAARESAAEIEAAAGGYGVVLLLAGLGGGTATGAAPIIAAQARARGAKVAALCTMPFEFEGPRRRAQAEAGLAELREVCDVVFAFENDRLAGALEEGAGIEEAFGLCGEMFGRLAEAMHRTLACRGLIDLDMADLGRVVGVGDCGISWAEGAGPKRLEEALGWIMEGPLLRDRTLAGDADAVVQVTGGPELTLTDVQKITRQIRQVVGPSGTVSLGATVDASMAGRIRLLLILSRPDGFAMQEESEVEVSGAESPELPAPRKKPARPKMEKAVRAAIPPPPPPPPVVEEETEEEEEPAVADLPPMPSFEPPPHEFEPETVAADEPAAQEDEAFEAPEPVRRGAHRMRVPLIRVEAEAEEDPRFGVEGEAVPLLQASFNFDMPSRGRFDSTEVTMHRDQNLDIPTFLRRRLRIEPVE